MRRLNATSLACFLVLASLSLAAPALAVDAAGLPAAIENAKTAADHEAIAASYDAEAKAATATAERHRAMGDAYKKSSKAPAGKGNRMAIYRTMPDHCGDLVEDYKKAAHEYEKMAAAHRKAASEIK